MNIGKHIKVGLMTILCLGLLIPLRAQENNPITTAAPFLLIIPDARAGGMADMGVATSPDHNNQFHNPSKTIFNSSSMSFGINFTPWMNKIVDDVYLGTLSVNSVINERSAWGAGFKYFTLGEIQLTDQEGTKITKEKPNELSLDGSYVLKLNDNYGMGVTLRYIRSDFALKVANSNLKTVNTFGVDISGFYKSDVKNYGDFKGAYRGGFNVSNIGPKVNYTDGGYSHFIPTNLALGAGFDFIFDSYNTLGVTLETNKLLVPTPNPENDEEEIGFVEGIFKSFGDAPGGSKEEFQEFTWALAAEYLYTDAFALRAGYFHENPNKGNRQYFTIGAGIKFKATTVDLSYLFNASDLNHPLENTLRFSVGINLGDIVVNKD